MRPVQRPGFVLSPRLAFPVLLVIVLAMFVVFTSLDSHAVSTARVVATVIVSAAILVLFGILAIISRGRRRDDEEEV